MRLGLIFGCSFLNHCKFLQKQSRGHLWTLKRNAICFFANIRHLHSLSRSAFIVQGIVLLLPKRNLLTEFWAKYSFRLFFIFFSPFLQRWKKRWKSARLIQLQFACVLSMSGRCLDLTFFLQPLESVVVVIVYLACACPELMTSATELTLRRGVVYWYLQLLGLVFMFCTKYLGGGFLVGSYGMCCVTGDGAVPALFRGCLDTQRVKID